jgi:hypothetical protein
MEFGRKNLLNAGKSSQHPFHTSSNIKSINRINQLKAVDLSFTTPIFIQNQPTRNVPFISGSTITTPAKERPDAQFQEFSRFNFVTTKNGSSMMNEPWQNLQKAS